MNKVQVIIDSTCDLTLEMANNNKMIVIPLGVNFGLESFKDGVDITPDQLYAKVAKDGKLPTTAAISPEALHQTFAKAIEDECDVVFVGIGSTLSGTYQNARIACDDLPDNRVFLIDSKNLSSGSGLLALKCAKLRDEGKSAKEIHDIVSALVEKLSVRFAVETLDYLYKGGRCSGAAKIAGKLFHVHPIIRVVDGKLVVASKPRGKMEKACDEMVEELKADMPNIDMDHVMITHSGVDKEIESYLYGEVCKVVDPSIVSISHAGCVVCTHCGYGTIGILYIKK